MVVWDTQTINLRRRCVAASLVLMSTIVFILRTEGVWPEIHALIFLSVLCSVSLSAVCWLSWEEAAACFLRRDQGAAERCDDGDAEDEEGQVRAHVPADVYGRKASPRVGEDLSLEDHRLNEK